MRLADADDRTTRARVRDTAIEVFARDGFTATVRTIAEAAGVSPGLVIHHFGSKEKLRAECDEHVLRQTREANEQGLDEQAGPHAFAGFVRRMEDIDSDGPRIVYLIRSLQAGGEMARQLLAHLAEDAEQTFRKGVAAGTIRPSRDEAARARYMVAQSMGALLVDVVMNPPADWSDAGVILQSYVDRVVLPAAELAVHGVMTDESLLDAVLAYREERNDHDSD
ncbi:TetR family transcriptional regulator [Gordonia sp. Z-3]|jgi:AcrR family transcriptional regulator|uniref:TetR family transcriptional regulator n=1 Tax=Gordonia tangerina TaxID=2911060 RepID=A0ABS9DNN3_9ACTN|nr:MULTISPECIES: TetR family transcriptional regulator [Gordonia]MAU83954.1 TetR family transcriptional regulator [Gordonia sp. (in: high G+C Gram-positive bacteria)]MCF3940706.1 TetR family transcriptional regulator [Gordonia tangerina]MED5800011.1 TetR family transcriptional regulator [Gordonia sp. Z-3]